MPVTLVYDNACFDKAKYVLLSVKLRQYFTSDKTKANKSITVGVYNVILLHLNEKVDEKELAQTKVERLNFRNVRNLKKVRM